MKKVINIGGLAVNERIEYVSGNGRCNANTNQYPTFTFWRDRVPMDKGEDDSEWAKAVDDANEFIKDFCKGGEKLAVAISATRGADAKAKTINYIKDTLSTKAKHLVLNEWLNGIDRWNSLTVQKAVMLVDMMIPFEEKWEKWLKA